MSAESEAALEDKLIKRLVANGYKRVKIDNDDQLNVNFKEQLEKLNEKELEGTKLTDEEFDKILTKLNSGTIFDKSEKLRDVYRLKREGKPTISLRFLNQKDWCKNIFQVSNQITMRGKHENRYDVTILINGLPLVQIELKKRKIAIKKAFNQVKRYMKNKSYKGLFGFIQLFVISNGCNTKYFSNGRYSDVSFEFTYWWKDEKNNNIYQLSEFTDDFLDKCNIAKMISKYMVLNQSSKKLMVLRAYQKYAVEAVLNQALEIKQNGYIWHTTGSGKTLTSFKVSQLLAEEEDIYKVIFVVDRRDLDTQTNKEFNYFCPGCVDNSKHTGELVKNLLSGKNKLITTTIQKLSIVVNRQNTRKQLEKIRDKNIILIFDECHRSQFGKMHNDIQEFFTNTLSYGFTGTPIFEENANGYKTTKSIFGKRLHTYMIKDAIADENVLGFSVEYWNTLKLKEGAHDEEVHSINKEEVLASEKRLRLIVNHIIKNYKKKTKNKEFNAIFAVDRKSKNNPSGFIHDYYRLFKESGTDLKIATIFTWDSNEDLEDKEEHSMDLIDKYMKDYNEMFGTNFSIETYAEYHLDVTEKMKNREIDLLLVVDMFLTGFDSPRLNTLYVDKHLEYHTLLQAFSRTNRIYNQRKSQGNIVCYRIIKDETDNAIALFSNNEPSETIVLPPYEYFVKEFNKDLETLYKLVEKAEDVYNLQSENDKRNFVLGFKRLMKTKNKLDIFTDFKFKHLNLTEQEYNDFTSAYLDVIENDKEADPGTSILEDIDFELELLRNDEINVDYILTLLESIEFTSSNYENERKRIIKIMKESYQLRSKIALIEKFIDNELFDIKQNNLNIKDEFDNFMRNEKRDAICRLIDDEELNEEIAREILNEYEFSEQFDDALIKKSFTQKLKYKERKNKVKSVKNKMLEIFDMYDYE